MVMNKVLVAAGIITLIQAGGQATFAALSIAQYFCLLDFLRELPLLLYIKILYFHNPDTCGVRVNIGQSIAGMANQAFVLVTRQPDTVFRTFTFNVSYLPLCVIWLITGIVILYNGVRNNPSKHIRWPWIVTTVLISTLDLVASVTYANDSFQTRTLSDMMSFIGGVASGTGNIDLNTSMASWTMVIWFSRFAIIFFLNLALVILMLVDCSKQRESDTAKLIVEDASPELMETDPIEIPTVARAEVNSERDVEVASSQIEAPPRIPRPGLSQSFRRMKTFLFKKASPSTTRRESTPDSLEDTPDRSPRVLRGDGDKKRTVNFPKNLLSLPQRLENLIAEQQRRLDKAVIDTSGRRSPPRTSQSMPQLDTTLAQANRTTGRRGTAVELQGQLPWAYIPAPAHRMRDQLPPDEDLPPVPLPDYTAIQSFRKASVHRAASSLSSLTQKKDYISKSQPPINQSDVLY